MIDNELANQIQTFFKQNNYVVIKNHISPETAAVCYQYAKTKVQAIDFKLMNESTKWDEDWDGKFGDGQIEKDFNSYGDPLMDSILAVSHKAMQEYTGLNLVPNYSYWRFYEKGSELKKHTDRVSCEISTTLCLGYDVSNLETKYNWPMYIKVNGQDVPLFLEPGDMIVYRGTIVEHWREPFLGLNHAQVFLHYNDLEGPYKNKYDGRPILGIPQRYGE
jgi:hypothetical protein